jgi:acyl dehydratase
MPPDGYHLTTILQFVGRELGVSDWLTVDQQRIDQFAACTGDRQWIHVDVERARRESPFGTPIAHGYLILALLPQFQFAIGMVPPGIDTALNYGLDRVRFLAPVKTGARIRNRLELLMAEDKGGGRVLITTRNTIEIAGQDKPAMIAETLALLFAR